MDSSNQNYGNPGFNGNVIYYPITYEVPNEISISQQQFDSFDRYSTVTSYDVNNAQQSMQLNGRTENDDGILSNRVETDSEILEQIWSSMSEEEIQHMLDSPVNEQLFIDDCAVTEPSQMVFQCDQLNLPNVSMDNGSNVTVNNCSNGEIHSIILLDLSTSGNQQYFNQHAESEQYYDMSFEQPDISQQCIVQENSYLPQPQHMATMPQLHPQHVSIEPIIPLPEQDKIISSPNTVDNDSLSDMDLPSFSPSRPRGRPPYPTEQARRAARNKSSRDYNARKKAEKLQFEQMFASEVARNERLRNELAAITLNCEAFLRNPNILEADRTQIEAMLRVEGF